MLVADFSEHGALDLQREANFLDLSPLQIAGHIESASIAADALLRDPATELTDFVKHLRQRNYKARDA